MAVTPEWSFEYLLLLRVAIYSTYQKFMNIFVVEGVWHSHCQNGVSIFYKQETPLKEPFPSEV